MDYLAVVIFHVQQKCDYCQVKQATFRQIQLTSKWHEKIVRINFCGSRLFNRSIGCQVKLRITVAFIGRNNNTHRSSLFCTQLKVNHQVNHGIQASDWPMAWLTSRLTLIGRRKDRTLKTVSDIIKEKQQGYREYYAVQSIAENQVIYSIISIGKTRGNECQFESMWLRRRFWQRRPPAKWW